MRLFYELHVVLEISDVLAGDADASRPRRLPALPRRDLDGVARLEGQLRAVPVKAPSNDFLTLRSSKKADKTAEFRQRDSFTTALHRESTCGRWPSEV